MKIPSQYTLHTGEECRTVDSKTVHSFGIDAFTLMELAGSKAAKIIRKKMDDPGHGIFLCGKGNNCGDALAAARYLLQHEIAITILFAGGTDKLSELAQKNYNLLKNIKRNDSEAIINFIENRQSFNSAASPDFIVDGMLGIGLNSELRGAYNEAVKWANAQKAPCFAMDIPTGLHADTGKIMGNSIYTSHTLAFGSLKQGFYLNDGKEYCGEIHFCELPFPNYLKAESSTFLIDDDWLPKLQKEPARHKYEGGVVYVIGGSEGLTGAAILAAKSAWAEGLGAVVLICPKGLLSVFENNLPQVIKKPVGEDDDQYFKENHVEEVKKIIHNKKGVSLLGPGLGRQKSTVKFVKSFLEQNKADCIIDADALWALSRNKKWQKPKKASWILTPHPGELSNLLDSAIDNDFNRLKAIKRMASAKNITLLSKGYPAMVCTPTCDLYLSEYDNRSFSRAGFGDILAGKVSAFKALHRPAAESCLRALLSGEKKMKKLQNQYSDHTPEPLDFI